MERQAIAFLREKLEKHPFFKETGAKLELKEQEHKAFPDGAPHPGLSLAVRLNRGHFAKFDGASKLLNALERYFPEESTFDSAREIMRIVRTNYRDRESDVGTGMTLKEWDWQNGKTELQGAIIQHVCLYAKRQLKSHPELKNVFYAIVPVVTTGAVMPLADEKRVKGAVELQPEHEVLLLFGEKLRQEMDGFSSRKKSGGVGGAGKYN